MDTDLETALLGDLIQEAGCSTGPEHDRIANAIERSRQESGLDAAAPADPVEILWACAAVHPLVARTLGSAFGSVAEQWRNRTDPGPLRDFVVDAKKFRDYISDFKIYFDRTVIDALGLAWTLVHNAGDSEVGSRLTSAGLDPEWVQRLLRWYGRQVEPGIYELPFECLPTDALLDKFTLSSFVSSDVFRYARGFQVTEARAPVMSPLSLFMALLVAGSDSGVVNTADFLVELFSRSLPDEASQEFGEWRVKSVEEIGEALGNQTTPPSLPLQAAGAVERVLKDAEAIALRTTGRQTICARHLLASLLRTMPLGNEPSKQFFPSIDLEAEPDLPRPKQIAEELLQYLARHAGSVEKPDDQVAWREVLAPITNTISTIPSYDAENTSGEDLLDIRDDVNAFSYFLAAGNIDPPLSIGLFGDWGSGKSFFMSKMRDRIDELCQGARKNLSAGEESAFLREIVQIEFNAWNYVEANLWASLATHIFEHLHQHFTPSDEAERRNWAQILKKLDDALLLRADAEANVKQAERELEEAQAEYDSQSLGLVAAVKGAIDALENDDNLGSQIGRLKKDLGTAAVQDLMSEILVRKQEAESLIQRYAIFRSVTFRSLGSMRSMGWVALVIAAVIGAMALLNNYGLLDQMQGLSGRVAELVALLGGASAWLGSAFRRANAAMDTIENIDRNWQTSLGDTEQAEKLRQARSGALSARDVLEERRKRLAEVRSQLTELQPSERLSNFLKERAASTDYRQYLGLPAIIRKDFERLHLLMSGQNPIEFKIPVPAAQPAVATPADAAAAPESQRILKLVRAELQNVDVPLPVRGVEIEATTGAGQNPAEYRITDSELPREIEVSLMKDGAGQWLSLDCKVNWQFKKTIDRIVLYIDDLDRCPPRRVIEVLQAVHLLLAFPLFVVVVGVDARWVSRALKTHYKTLWRTENDEHGDAGDPESHLPGHAAEPHDYLEKIFQVPFWLCPMSEKATANFIGKLVAKEIDAGVAEPEVKTHLFRQPEKAQSGREGGTEPAKPSPPDADKTRLVGTPVESAPTRAVEGGGAEEASGALAFGRRPNPAVQELPEQPLSPEDLRLSNQEAEYMKKLAPVVGRSPRAVKRFVNIYRLIRARRNSTQDRYLFVGTPERPGPYRLVMTLLAIVVGRPPISEDLFKQLLRFESYSLSTFFDELNEWLESIWENLGEEAKKDWEDSKPFIRDLAILQQEGIRVAEFKDYAREVGRYSFRVGHFY